MIPEADDHRPRGLRERKKAKTRAAIQEQALRLFRERGYAETTIEQIAEAAEVSPATFFRYFPTKEDVVLYDVMDEDLMETLRAQPSEASAISAIRGALREVFTAVQPDELAVMRERDRLMRSVPELRARMINEFVGTFKLFCDEVASRTGRKANDFDVQGLVGAVIGIGLALWLSADESNAERYLELYDRGLKNLESGFRL